MKSGHPYMGPVFLIEALLMKRLIYIILACLAAATLGSYTAQAAQYTDELGRTISLPNAPQRLIGLTPALTETIFALGLGDKAVGATTWADYPEAAQKLPRVGSYVAPNLERIIELAPDLILASREGNPPQVVESLERMGLNVYVIAPDDPLNLPSTLAKLGRICGVPETGRLLADKMQKQFAKVIGTVAEAPKPATLMVVGSEPLITAGDGSLTNALLVMAGGKNIAKGVPGRWPKLSIEKVIEEQPEVVILSTMERGMEREKVMNYWRNMPGLKERPNLRVSYIESSIIDRPGPRLGLGLLELARLIHPELFTGENQ